jgi:hypothetical protein
MRPSQLIDKILALIVVMMLIVFTVYGQTPPPAGNEEGAPLDSLAAALLIGAGGYAVYRLKQHKPK